LTGANSLAATTESVYFVAAGLFELQDGAKARATKAK